MGLGLGLLRLGRALPVVQHLGRQNDIQRESGYEPVQNDLVVNLLEGGEDPRERADEVVENLQKKKKKKKKKKLASNQEIRQSTLELTAKALNWPVPPSRQIV